MQRALEIDALLWRVIGFVIIFVSMLATLKLKKEYSKVKSQPTCEKTKRPKKEKQDRNY